jgi:predicted methyltransferase
MEFQMIRRTVAVLLTLGILGTGTGVWAGENRALQQAVASPLRGADNVARDGARHPYETLKFWGVKPRATVIELTPGSGYWTDILAVYAKATKGKYIAGLTDLANPKVTEAGRKARANFEAKYADIAKYGTIGSVDFGAQSAALGQPGSADMVITARNIHNWLWQPPMFYKVMADAYAVLKPGGILAVEEHRADPRAQIGDARDGYVSTAIVVDAAKKAGFVLQASSEINANPKDTKDHPFGVWTLPPNRRTMAGNGNDPNFDRAKYDAIGESDRMTLRFIKPR